MTDASPSLLLRLQYSGDPAAWERLVDLYTPLLYLWACRAGLQGEEAAQLVRDVFTTVAREMPSRSAGAPALRTWLRNLAASHRRELLRKRPVPVGAPPGGVMAVEPSPPPAAADALWEAEYLPFLLGQAVALLQPHFPPVDWKACWGVCVEGRPATDVGRELGLDVAAVCAAEARVLRHVRKELDGMLD